MMKRALLLASTASLAGCTVGPDYHAPDMHTPVSYQEPASAAGDVSRWWLQIPDPELQTLITRALAANLDLQTAASRVRQARDQETITGAAALPQAGTSAIGAKLHSNSSPLGGPSGQATNINLYSLGFDASWEIDVFGGTRRAAEAARAATEGAVWQLRDVQVSLSAEVANDYMILRAAQARLAVLRENLDSESQVLRFAESRASAGFLTQLDVNQQRAEVAAVAAQIPPVEAMVRIETHAIAVLLAEEPAALTAELERAAELPATPAAPAVGLPSDLLRRRPDVRAAERKLAAATAEEGVAVAALYPKFDLLGLVSLATSNISNLFTADSLGEAAGGRISWPIFSGGRLHANIRIKQEDKAQAYNAYRTVVLRAIQDVEDALVRLHSEQKREGDLKSSVEAARSSVALANGQYRTGLAPYLNVLTAQKQFNEARDQLIQNRQAQAQNAIALFKALGGGWSDEPTTNSVAGH